MRGKGITYDTGFFHPGAVTSTRDVFDPEVVRREDELLDLLAVCAEGAERLRRQGAEVVLLTGSELSLFTVGFLSGDRLDDRLGLLATPGRLRGLLAEVPARINDFLTRAVEVVGARFGGRVSYASLPLEEVDWAASDLISSDAGYRG